MSPPPGHRKSRSSRMRLSLKTSVYTLSGFRVPLGARSHCGMSRIAPFDRHHVVELRDSATPELHHAVPGIPHVYAHALPCQPYQVVSSKGLGMLMALHELDSLVRSLLLVHVSRQLDAVTGYQILQARNRLRDPI